MSVRECAVAFLPAEPSVDKSLFVDVICGIRFDISNQVRQGHCRSEPNQNVNMIFHTID